MTTVSEIATGALRLAGVGKRFGATVALADVELEIERGTIHGLVGENGAGKSTLLGILAGRLVPDSGQAWLHGAPLPSGDPRASRAAGIVAIYQELTIVPTLSAVANVCLGAAESHGGWQDRRAMRRRFDELADRLGARIDPQARADTLSIADQQLLEVMRALHVHARVILFDEPTAPLAEAERASLLALMSDLRAQGVTMVFVSHNLGEVLEISDRVSVFRDGRLVATRPTEQWSKQMLVGAMLGEAGGALATAASASAPRRRRATSTSVLTVRGLTIPGVLTDISLDVRSGEIVGVAGLVGSGRTSLLRALAGLERSAHGSLQVRGSAIAWPRTVRAAVGHGIALVPEDRKGQGLVLGLTAMRNVTLSDMGAVADRGWSRPRRMRQRAASATSLFGFDAARLGEPVANLSGGNQQKVLLARWAHRWPTILLADEPTRGIDVGAKAQILETLRAFTERDAAVLMVSSEHEELIATADRIVVLSRGRLVAELDNAARDVTEQDLLHAAFDLEDAHARA
jgi:rhamnose transport system ATP-binding protein